MSLTPNNPNPQQTSMRRLPCWPLNHCCNRSHHVTPVRLRSVLYRSNVSAWASHQAKTSCSSHDVLGEECDLVSRVTWNILGTIAVTGNKQLDDGWPESVEEQGLLLLVWRHHIRNNILKMCYRKSRRGVLRQNSRSARQ